MSPEMHALEHVALPEFRLGETVAGALEEGAPDGWQGTGMTREYYLDVAKKIVRAARGWQDGGGAIIDPVAGTEEGQTSSRYVSPGAVLLAFGRAPELAESIYLGMDWCCKRLLSGEAKSPDFWMRELMTAFFCLQPIAEPERLAQWAADLSRNWGHTSGIRLLQGTGEQQKTGRWQRVATGRPTRHTPRCARFGAALDRRGPESFAQTANLRLAKSEV